jgi:DNA-binding transcriptional regulator LsrR (DeoR family)
MEARGIAQAKRNIRSILSIVDHFRTQFGLNIDELMIFMTVGDLNVSSRKAEFLYIRPTNMTAVAYNLNIPRETVRRKIRSLADKGLLKVRNREIFVAHLDDWVAISNKMREYGEAPTALAS